MENLIESNLDGDPEMYRQAGIVYRVVAKPGAASVRGYRGSRSTIAYTHEVRTDRTIFYMTGLDAAHSVIQKMAKCEHKGVKFYDREMCKRKFSATDPKELKPPSFRRFGKYRYSEVAADFVVEYQDLRAVVNIASQSGNREAVTRNVYLAVRAHRVIVKQYDRQYDIQTPVVLQTEVDERGDHWVQFRPFPTCTMDRTLERLGEWEKRDGKYYASGAGL